MNFSIISSELQRISDLDKATVYRTFFKIQPGEYGEGDTFIGVSVPIIRKIAIKYQDTPYQEISTLLHSDIHEYRACGLFILVGKFNRGDDKEKHKVYTFYVKHMDHVNNWDLVDLSAPYIVGGMLWSNKNFEVLEKWALSKNLWKRRISIVSTMYLIRKGYFSPTLQVSKILLSDPHDLIHKAVGWMLREAGKKDFSVVQTFVDQYGLLMPRTMLRYAIERFPKDLRLQYLKKTRT